MQELIKFLPITKIESEANLWAPSLKSWSYNLLETIQLTTSFSKGRWALSSISQLSRSPHPHPSWKLTPQCSITPHPIPKMMAIISNFQSIIRIRNKSCLSLLI